MVLSSVLARERIKMSRGKSDPVRPQTQRVGLIDTAI